MNDNGKRFADDVTVGELVRLRAEVERLQKDYALAWENHLLHEQLFVLTEAKIERLREALRIICDGPRDVEKSYAELFAEVKIEARAALKEDE